MKITTLVAALFLTAGVAFAQNSGTQSTSSQDQMQTEHHRHNGDRKEDMQEHIDKMATELNLTADQKTQVQDIMKDQMSQAKSIRQDSSLSADQKKDKEKELHESTHQKINAVLTPDQQTKFKAMQKEMREDRKEHREHKHGDMDKDNNTSK